MLLVAGVAGCGGNSAASAAAGSGATPPTTSTASRAHGQTASCISALTPWTQYIADSDDFNGWVETVGKTNPVVQLPQNAAKVYLGEVSKSGSIRASDDGFNELDQACGAFAVTDPTFNFKALPSAPSLPS